MFDNKAVSIIIERYYSTHYVSTLSNGAESDATFETNFLEIYNQYNELHATPLNYLVETTKD